MPSCVSPDTRISLFADDAKLERKTSSIDDDDDQVDLKNDPSALIFGVKHRILILMKNKKYGASGKNS